MADIGIEVHHIGEAAEGATDAMDAPWLRSPHRQMQRARGKATSLLSPWGMILCRCDLDATHHRPTVKVAQSTRDEKRRWKRARPRRVEPQAVHFTASTNLGAFTVFIPEIRLKISAHQEV